MNLFATFRPIVSAFALILLPLFVQAAEAPYSKAQFDTALAQGKPVIVHFSADWCPTCKAQKPIIESLLKGEKLKNITFLTANYDTEADFKKQLHITQQSTFVVFKDGKEAARSTGQTDKQAIAALFDKAL